MGGPTFWFQRVRGVRAGGQRTVNFPHLVGVSASATQLEEMAQNILYSPHEERKALEFVEWLLSCLTIVLSFCISHFSD